MREVALFGEDRAHQLVVGALLRRLAEEHRVEVSLVWRQAYGGHGRMKRELNDYLRALHRSRELLPDLVVAATDANCSGLNARTREISNLDARTPPTVLAIPDPHVERWLLLDGAAFKTVLGRGCRAPDRKCDRDRYKQRLVEAIRAAGVEPSLDRRQVRRGVAPAEVRPPGRDRDRARKPQGGGAGICRRARRGEPGGPDGAADRTRRRTDTNGAVRQSAARRQRVKQLNSVNPAKVIGVASRQCPFVDDRRTRDNGISKAQLALIAQIDRGIHDRFGQR